MYTFYTQRASVSNLCLSSVSFSPSLCLSVCFLPGWEQVGVASVESRSHDLPYARERCMLVIVRDSCVRASVRVPRWRAVRFVTLAGSQQCSLLLVPRHRRDSFDQVFSWLIAIRSIVLWYTWILCVVEFEMAFDSPRKRRLSSASDA